MRVALYRCRNCGAFARPLHDNATDVEYPMPPTGDCKCFNGPSWERGEWRPLALLAPDTTTKPIAGERVAACGICESEWPEHDEPCDCLCHDTTTADGVKCPCDCHTGQSWCPTDCPIPFADAAPCAMNRIALGLPPGPDTTTERVDIIYGCGHEVVTLTTSRDVGPISLCPKCFPDTTTAEER